MVADTGVYVDDDVYDGIAAAIAVAHVDGSGVAGYVECGHANDNTVVAVGSDTYGDVDADTGICGVTVAVVAMLLL